MKRGKKGGRTTLPAVYDAGLWEEGASAALVGSRMAALSADVDTERESAREAEMPKHEWNTLQTTIELFYC